jgi:hypothetical protein
MTNEEWERRYKARIVERLLETTGPVDDRVSAENMAQATFDACELADIQSGFEDDPEGSAEEELSYWGDGE